VTSSWSFILQLCSMFYNSADGRCYNTLHILPTSAHVNTNAFTTEEATAWVTVWREDIYRRLRDRVTLFGESVETDGVRLFPSRWQRIVGKFGDQFENFIGSFCGTPFPIFTPYFRLKQWKHG